MTTRELKDSTSLASTTEYGVAKLAASGATTAGLAVQGSDTRLTAAADLATHLADAADAHDASAISFSPTGTIAATDAQAAIAEVASEAAAALTAHTGDTADAHAATAIGFTPAGSIAATTVQAAIEEVASEAGGDPASATHAAASKATPVDADEVPLIDSAASFALKKLTWANLKATAKTYFDTIYGAINADTTGKSAKSDALNSATTVVNVAAATAPSAGQVLTATDGTHATWETPASGFSDPLTTRGDIIYRDASATTRLPLGSAGQRPKSDGTDLVYGDDWVTLTFVIDGGGSAIATGIKGDLEIPDDYTITRATLLADQSGSIVVDLWVDAYANYPPTVADTITASAKPTISSATKSQDTTLTGWANSAHLSAGDILRVNVDSCTSIIRCTLALRCKKRS